MGVVTKAVGGVIGAWGLGRWRAVVVGFGMVPRGELWIVVAGLGLSLGLLTSSLFNEILIAVVVTTLVAPYILRFGIPRALTEDGPPADVPAPPQLVAGSWHCRPIRDRQARIVRHLPPAAGLDPSGLGRRLAGRDRGRGRVPGDRPRQGARGL